MIDTKEREVIVLSGKAAWAETQASKAEALAETKKRQAENATREAERLRKIAEELWAGLETARAALRREGT